MALSKIQAESINLADTFAFTGTVSGVGFTFTASQTLSSTTGVTFTGIPSGVKIIKFFIESASTAQRQTSVCKLEIVVALKPLAISEAISFLPAQVV